MSSDVLTLASRGYAYSIERLMVRPGMKKHSARRVGMRDRPLLTVGPLFSKFQS